MKYSESVRAIKAFEKKYGIRFNLNMSGKMADIKCLSTSNLCNPFCACRKNSPALICNKCFADSTCSRYAALRTNMERNTDILTSVMIPVEEWPLLNSVEDPIFRFESFGDLVNEIQAQNYMNMARRNPKTRFALWTKNPGSFRLFCVQRLPVTERLPSCCRYTTGRCLQSWRFPSHHTMRRCRARIEPAAFLHSILTPQPLCFMLE